MSGNRGSQLSRQPAIEASYGGGQLQRKSVIEATSYWGGQLSRQSVIEATSYWGDQLLRRPVIEAASYQGGQLLGLPVVEVASYWEGQLWRKSVIEAARYRSMKLDASISGWLVIGVPVYWKWAQSAGKFGSKNRCVSGQAFTAEGNWIESARFDSSLGISLCSNHMIDECSWITS